jgi:hypothetical protein
MYRVYLTGRGVCIHTPLPVRYAIIYYMQHVYLLSLEGTPCTYSMCLTGRGVHVPIRQGVEWAAFMTRASVTHNAALGLVRLCSDTTLTAAAMPRRHTGKLTRGL